ncbi:DEAD/DEAH box helicase [Saccharicrinis sp. FJH62]|uniref:DEAD/DEAH box helicase n=1 Tax=Saccharicrinis sp. FJH62 TaxID=3344657 RepID=UPI0035D4F9D6
MQYQFIITITEHRYLGWIVVPTLVKRTNESFITFHEQASTFHFGKEGYEFEEHEKTIIRYFEKYSEHNLVALFSKTKTVNEFFGQLTLDRFEERIRPFIEEWADKILNIIVEYEIPVFIRKPNYNNLYDADQLKMAGSDSKTIFNFKDEKTAIHYSLSIRHRGDDIKLMNKNLIILSNSPAWVVIGHSLFNFNDVDAKKLQPFTKKRHIEIPGSARNKYMETFVLNAIKNNTVLAEGFSIIDQEPEHSAHLFLEEDLDGQPVLSLKFKYGNRYFIRSGRKAVDVSFFKENEAYIFQRFNRKWIWEEELEQKLTETGVRKQQNSFFRPEGFTDNVSANLYMLVNWINKNTKKLNEIGFEIDQSHYKTTFYTGNIDLTMDMSDTIDWFELYGTVKLGGYTIPFIRFKKHILTGTREYQLPDGEVVVLPTEWFTRYQEIFKFSKEKEDKIVLDKIHFNLLQNRDVRQVDREVLEDVYSHRPDINIPVPESLNATLRSYQKEGYSWLMHLRKNEFGGCLADDMGLGKTLQALTVLQYIYEGSFGTKKRRVVNRIIDDTKPKEQLNLFDQKLNDEPETEAESHRLPASIIVMPKSLLHNWQNEIKKFCPGMLVYTYTGNKRLRSMDIWKIFRHFNVILTSYGVVRNDLEFLKTYQYHYLILDESHFIKNPSSKIYRAVNQLDAKHRLAITGTPIENSLQDLWAQFNFINPGLLGSQNYFRNHFVIPITKNKDEKREERLQKIIQPFILRRTKHQVAKDLPPLHEQVLYCAMTDDQKRLYEKEKSGIRNNLLQNIESAGVDKTRLLALQGLMRLRLLANHPVLVNKEYEGDSGKYDRIKRNLKNLKAEKHKVLVFSSFVKHLKILEKYFIKKEWKYSMLTGATENREQVIDAFMNDPDNHVFLISLKAGGVGLNLTEADYVFIIDPWWNPAAEMQAVNRAHRIGQDKHVMVYRFITSDSIEEKISKLQEKKSELASTFINTNNPFQNLSQKEIDELFR